MTFSFEKLSQHGNPQSNFTSSVCKWTVFYTWAIFSHKLTDVSSNGKPVQKNIQFLKGVFYEINTTVFLKQALIFSAVSLFSYFFV